MVAVETALVVVKVMLSLCVIRQDDDDVTCGVSMATDCLFIPVCVCVCALMCCLCVLMSYILSTASHNELVCCSSPRYYFPEKSE